MFIIFGLIFNVNVKDNERFLEKDQIVQELKDAEVDYIDTKQKLEKVKKIIQALKEKKAQQYSVDDPAQLQAILDQDNEYLKFEKNYKEINEEFSKADFIKTTYSDYELFLLGVDDALKILELMLSSRTQGDTIEAIKVFKLLK